MKKNNFVFTLHSATIKTLLLFIALAHNPTFTLHSATIKTLMRVKMERQQIHLHYTLLLLKH